MSALYSARKIVWGVREPKLILGAPDGRQRLWMRAKEFARLYVKTRDGIRQFALEDKGSHWLAALDLEQGRNLRRRPIKH